MIRHRRRLTLAGVVISIAAPLLSACGDDIPRASSTTNAAMTPEQSHDSVMEVFHTIQSVVGRDGWDDDFDQSWGTCPSVDGTYRFSLYAARRLPLADSPDAVTEQVATALEAAGYENVRVQHDDTLRPPRTVIGYPNGYNGGTADDGFGIQFHAGTEYAATIIYGHCIPGDPPKLGTPLNPRPSDAP